MATSLEDLKTALRVLENAQNEAERASRLLKIRPANYSLKNLAEISGNTHSWVNNFSSRGNKDPDMKCVLKILITLLEIKNKSDEENPE